MDKERLKQQIDFIIEVDKLKHISRQTILINGTRKENDAEHSWHLALMAALLTEHLDTSVDLLKVMKMVLIHDLVEIDAGDTYCYDEKGAGDKKDRETKAADRLFNILPSDQCREIRGLWEEFEERTTPEARYAAALDRIQPFLLNYLTNGRSWKEHGISVDQVVERNKAIGEGSEILWAFVKELIEDAVEKGWLGKEDGINRY